ESFPRLIIKVSKFFATLSKYDFISFLNSETLAINITLYFYLYKYMYNIYILQINKNFELCNSKLKRLKLNNYFVYFFLRKKVKTKPKTANTINGKTTIII